jgi:hypothetical protein
MAMRRPSSCINSRYTTGSTIHTSPLRSSRVMSAAADGEESSSSSTTTSTGFLLFTPWRLVAATVLVAATTVDDAIWLIPFACSPTRSWQVRVRHMIVFVTTLVCLSILCCVVAKTFAAAAFVVVNDNEEDVDVCLGAIAAALCWIVAVALYVKKLLKKRKRQRQQQQQQQPCTQYQQTSDKGDYGAIEQGCANHDNVDNESMPTEERDDNRRLVFDPWTVMSLTFLGALDEISYFPALILGHVFAPLELVLGTLFAALLICGIISTTFLLAPCRPVMAWLDTIPLYAVVAVFAIVLTTGVVVDVLHNNDDNDNTRI